MSSKTENPCRTELAALINDVITSGIMTDDQADRYIELLVAQSEQNVVDQIEFKQAAEEAKIVSPCPDQD
jgi:polyhydroxyalkanoate synthesis regulator phasin